MSGIFITFEGIDFCGKSVQLELLQKRIINVDKQVVVIREPGGTVISEKIRQMLLDKNNMEMTPITEFLLYSAARSQLVIEKIIPELNSGKIVLCDRYYDSSTAYQGFGRELDLNIVNNINNFATYNISPHITFLLDIDINEVEKRKKKINVELDRIENESKTFFNVVRQGYLQIAKDNHQQFKVIDGKKTIPEIEKEIWNHFWSYLQGV